MRLSTPVAYSNNGNRLDFATHFTVLGSCFSEHIGGHLADFGFQALTNPLGIAYDPISIAQHLNYVIAEEQLDSSLFLHRDDIHLHYHFHSQLYGLDRETFAQQLQHRIQLLKQHLQESDVLILTFGTAIIQRLLESQKTVTNCHKQPKALFHQEFVNSLDLETMYHDVISQIQSKLPNIELIVTVSPIRHTRHGLIDNSRSKSRLLLLCEYLETTFDNVHYFPSFEILTDELRDYSFYANDLIHPNDRAIHHIWDAFSANHFTPQTLEVIQQIERLSKKIYHKALHPESKSHSDFVSQLHEEINSFKHQYPDIKFSALSTFENRNNHQK